MPLNALSAKHLIFRTKVKPFQIIEEILEQTFLIIYGIMQAIYRLQLRLSCDSLQLAITCKETYHTSIHLQI